jgi:hypothetical protein
VRDVTAKLVYVGEYRSLLDCVRCCTRRACDLVSAEVVLVVLERLSDVLVCLKIVVEVSEDCGSVREECWRL